ncbi:hypothetical protein ACIQWZ_36580 [Streptomyces sp. NPDC098077]|uniref:hypothetical protein n=1 Tax=Streptomyces sp. NPDC098077 TaxID=3366093 RepID=UPI0037F6D414
MRREPSPRLHEDASGIPLVKPATGLDVPDTVNFRITPVETYRRDQVANMSRNLRKCHKTIPYWRRPFVAALTAGLLLPLYRRKIAKVGGILVAGATFSLLKSEESETVFVPEALQHNGILTHEKYLTALTAHELLHQAQNHASGHRANWIANRALTLLDQGGINHLEEGHATWGRRTITQELYGTAVDTRSAPKSEKYKAIPQRGLQKKLEVYEGGCLLVMSAVRAAGLEKCNKVWADHQLLPNPSEVAVAAYNADAPTQPKLWAARLESAEAAEFCNRPSPD